jgi:hypothetical protein
MDANLTETKGGQKHLKEEIQVKPDANHEMIMTSMNSCRPWWMSLKKG